MRESSFETSDIVDDALLVNQKLAEARRQFDDLETRLENIEQSDLKELSVMAYELAGALEDARALLEDLTGPMDRETLHAEMQKHLSAEEFEEWLRDEPKTLEFREQWNREKSFRAQLS